MQQTTPIAPDYGTLENGADLPNASLKYQCQ